MLFVITQPDMLTAAAGNLAGVGSAPATANTIAATPTTALEPAAADEVSALTAAQFAAHAQFYQAASTQAAGIHHQFVTTLAASTASYAATEAVNAAATN